MRILIVQARENPISIAAEQSHYRRAVGDSAILEFLSLLDEKLAWTTPDEILEAYDGMILGGSESMYIHGGRMDNDPARLLAMIALSRARNIMSYAFAEELPLLGVCFGHQLIAQMRGGDVTHDHAQMKSGSFEVSLTAAGKADRLFGELPPSFVAQFGHKDSATALPEGATLLVSADCCRFSGLRYGTRAYTMQFHPELTAREAIVRLDACPEYLPEGVKARDVVRESPEASRLIPLWIERIVA